MNIYSTSFYNDNQIISSLLKILNNSTKTNEKIQDSSLTNLEY